jgi:hypothetical protein
MISLGQIAYEAYVKHSNGKSLISGQHLPNWEAQREDVKEAWEAAGHAAGNSAIEELGKQVMHGFHWPEEA